MNPEILFFLRVITALCVAAAWIAAAITLVEKGGKKTAFGVFMILVLMAAWVTFLMATYDNIHA